VLAGWFREVTFADLEAACDAVWAGAAYYTASQSLFFATAQGRALGTSRAITAVVRDLTGTAVEIVGKPSTHVLDVAVARTGVDPARLVVVGDDPELEMAMAHRGGCLAVAVATGVHDMNDPGERAALPPDQRPDLALAGVDELLRLLTTDPTPSS
jgi:NagD protein